MKRIGDSLGMLAVSMITVLAIALLLGPIVMSIIISFDARSYLGPFPPKDFSLRWYSKLFSNEYITQGIKTTLVIGFVATVVSTVVGTCTALGISMMRRHQALLLSIFLSPLMVPGVVLGFALLLFFSWVDIQSGLVRLVAGHIVITLPYTVRATLASVEGISANLLEAAQNLGATRWRAIFDVTLPLAKTGIVAGAVFAMAYSLDDVAVSIFLTDPDSQTLPIVLTSMMRSDFDLSIAAAAVIFIVLALALVVVLDLVIGLDRLIGRGVYRV